MRKIRPSINTTRIRQLCAPLHADRGRPSIPPEHLLLPLVDGYLRGVISERTLVRELTGNPVLRWFVRLDLDTVSYTVNGLMENHHRLLLGINVEQFRGQASETDGGRTLLDTFHQKHALRIQTVGADKEYFASFFLTAITRQRITPHVVPKTTGREPIHQHVRRSNRTVGYQLSQRARKKIEELCGEAKCWHGFRCFPRRGLLQVRDEAYLMGWLLNFKRLTTLPLAPV